MQPLLKGKLAGLARQFLFRIAGLDWRICQPALFIISHMPYGKLLKEFKTLT
jgi:hypothetical protein